VFGEALQGVRENMEGLRENMARRFDGVDREIFLLKDASLTHTRELKKHTGELKRHARELKEVNHQLIEIRTSVDRVACTSNGLGAAGRVRRVGRSPEAETRSR
jgi:hypothetical protein